MPKISERQQVLNSIDDLIFMNAIQEQRYQYDDPLLLDLRNSTAELLQLRFGILSTPYFNCQQPIPESPGFRELPDNEFKQQLRMNKESFCYIRSRIENHPVFRNKSFNKQEDVSLQMAVAFERFGTGASVAEIAQSKGISNGCVSVYCSRVITALLSLGKEFISWPSEEERTSIKERIQEKYGVSGCVGFLDGTEVVLSQRPSIDGETYWSKKQQYSLNVQLVCDDRLRILYYYMGWPGCVHDLTAFKESTMFLKPERFFATNEFVVGDSAYQLLSWLLIPFNKTELNADPTNAIFNEHISSMRILFEQVNGLLKSRWSCLKGIRTQVKKESDLKIIFDNIIAIFILHNILIQLNDDWQIENNVEDAEPEPEEDPICMPDGETLRNRVKQEILTRINDP